MPAWGLSVDVCIAICEQAGGQFDGQVPGSRERTQELVRMASSLLPDVRDHSQENAAANRDDTSAPHDDIGSLLIRRPEEKREASVIAVRSTKAPLTTESSHACLLLLACSRPAKIKAPGRMISGVLQYHTNFHKMSIFQINLFSKPRKLPTITSFSELALV